LASRPMGLRLRGTLDNSPGLKEDDGDVAVCLHIRPARERIDASTRFRGAGLCGCRRTVYGRKRASRVCGNTRVRCMSGTPCPRRATVSMSWWKKKQISLAPSRGSGHQIVLCHIERLCTIWAASGRHAGSGSRGRIHHDFGSCTRDIRGSHHGRNIRRRACGRAPLCRGRRAANRARWPQCHPEDMAELIVFLASLHAARITGQAISVNGGISAA
jgi:hypothetical protein